ncbi:MAG: stalk domain-containing protein [Clostridia bacterium]|nr:stalk domain-containing protein [Clostridia bacterium]
MKLIRIMIYTLSFLLLMSVAYAEVSVFVDEREVVFDDQPPVVVDNRTFVPLRKIFEELGASVDWIPETNTVYASKRFSSLMLTLGEDKYYINGEEKKLETPAFSLNNRTLIPVRAVSEALGADVLWNKDENKVLITLPQGERIIKDCYINGAETADDGTVVMTYRAAYPEILSDDSVCVAFNEFIRGDADDACQRGVMECLPAAKDAYINSVSSGTEFVPYMAEHTFDITYNDYNLISIICSDCNFSGGFHPNYSMYSMTYNLETGKMVEITDILPNNENVIRQDVYNLFVESINDTPESFYEDSVECLDEALNQLKWFLADDGVHFYLNPYEIAPYAMGVIDVVVPLEQLKLYK